MEDNSEKANKSLHFFFRCAGLSAVILSLRVKIISGISVNVVKELWLTFLYVFIVAIWLGLGSMFVVDLYKYIKSKIL